MITRGVVGLMEHAVGARVRGGCTRVVVLLGALVLRPGGACPRAESLRARVGAEAWVARLTSPDRSVRRGALYDLGRYAPPARPDETDRVTAEIVGVMNRESDPSVLLAGVAALAGGRHPQGICALAAVATSTHGLAPPAVQASAVRALGSADPAELARCPNAVGLGGRGANAAPAPVGGQILRVPVFGPPEVARAAAAALARLPEGEFAQTVTALRQGGSGQAVLMLRALAARGDARWGALVLDQLRATSPLVVGAAIEAAAALTLAEAASDLGEIARTAADRAIRRDALRALAGLGGPLESELRRAALASPVTRDAALEACARLGDRDAASDVAPWLDAPWAADRQSAAEVLGALGGAFAEAQLARRLGVERATEVRAGLYHALARAGSDAAVARLVRASRGEAAARWALVEWALRTHRRAPPAAVDPGALRAREPGALVLAALAGGHDDALLAALERGAAPTRATAALALALAPAPAVGPLLRRLAAENDEGTRAALVLAVGAAGGAAAREALATLLAREAEEPTAAAVPAAVVAGDLRLREAAGALRALLRAEAPAVRASAASALGRVGDPAARPGLEALANFEPDADVRGAAVLALAAVARGDALATVRAVQRIAWTDRLADLAARAELVARGAPPAGPVRGAAVVRVSGAAPSSVWGLALPDGSWRVTVAAADGEVVLPDAPSGAARLEALTPR